MSEAEEKTTADVLIGGYLYDVASFKHPGGSIVKFLTNNGDATEAFEEFHGRSKKAQAMLRSLPKVAAPRDVLDAREGNGRTDLTRGYARLREEFAREGRFDPNRSEIVYRVGEVVLMHVVGAYLVLATGYAAAGIILLGLASGRCGWLMHEAGHYSLTGEISVDRALQELSLRRGLRHVRRLVAQPAQQAPRDAPEAAARRRSRHAALGGLPRQDRGAGQKPPRQALAAAAVLPVHPRLVPAGRLGLATYLHPRHALRTKRKRELACMALRHVLLFGVVLRGMDHPVWAYLAYNQVAARLHLHELLAESYPLAGHRGDEFVHWVEYAAKHTTNISPSPLCNWWMANLNFQVEHHLFPAMPQFQHKHISPRVRAFFEAHGLVYDVRPYFSCLRQTLANLHAVGHSTKDD